MPSRVAARSVQTAREHDPREDRQRLTQLTHFVRCMHEMQVGPHGGGPLCRPWRVQAVARGHTPLRALAEKNVTFVPARAAPTLNDA